MPSIFICTFFHLSSSIASDILYGAPKELCSHGASGGISRFNDGRTVSLCDLIAERDDIGL
ncbi:MAG: hypothetical protein IJ756_07770 [Paludibacteraceae bacterium]|nr:hypothetical protein [Paludibacteraceae bacterium]